MKALCRASLIPEGFAVEGADTSGAAMVIAVRAMSTSSPYPACASPSLRIHSRYRRRLPDLPVGGRVMLLTTIARRFYCNAVGRTMRQIRQATGATTINPKLLTSAENLQYEGYQRREETNTAILDLAKDGTSIKEIVRRTGYSRRLVRSVLRGQRTEVFRIRQNSLEAHLPWLDEQWAAGLRNGAELWRKLRCLGFQGSLGVVGEWATRCRRSEKADSALGRAPAARTIARLMTVGRDDLTKAETVTIATIETSVPLLVEAREIVIVFQSMIRRTCATELSSWIDRARESLVASFANGVLKDRPTVAAAITPPWPNGQTEGQITKLKLIKGRGKLDRFEARVIGAS